MSRLKSRLITHCAAATAALALAGTAQAVDLRDWGRKYPANERFVLLSQFNNEAVLDKETQLVWQRIPAAQSTPWVLAKRYCLHLITAGRRGWRLPSVHELASLTDPSASPGTLALPPGHPFQGVPLGSYWTATRDVHGTTHEATGYTWFVALHNSGVSGSENVANKFLHYWCVRGAGVISDY